MRFLNVFLASCLMLASGFAIVNGLIMDSSGILWENSTRMATSIPVFLNYTDGGDYYSFIDSYANGTANELKLWLRFDNASNVSYDSSAFHRYSAIVGTMNLISGVYNGSANYTKAQSIQVVDFANGQVYAGSTTSRWTIAMWVYDRDSVGCYVSDYNTPNALPTQYVGWRFCNYRGVVAFFAGFVTSYNITYGTTPINNSQWHHIALVKNDTSRYLIFKDGVLENDTGNMGNIQSGAARRFIVGGYNVRGSIFEILNGSIDEMEVFTKAMTPDEIKALYNASKTNLNFTINVSEDRKYYVYTATVNTTGNTVINLTQYNLNRTTSCFQPYPEYNWYYNGSEACRYYNLNMSIQGLIWGNNTGGNLTLSYGTSILFSYIKKLTGLWAIVFREPCGDGVCDSGESCAMDNSSCPDYQCMDRTCDSGCGSTMTPEYEMTHFGEFIPQACWSTRDEAYGCGEGYSGCSCDGAGTCTGIFGRKK